MIGIFLDLIGKIKARIETTRKKHRWESLRKMGMHIGKGVNLPMSTWIDNSHCFLISIGDNCGFGDECFILAHDAMPNEYLDASVLGKVTIHESCHFGVRTVILPGVTIGPRSIVGSNSVVVNDIPPNSVAAGNPAKVLCTLNEYLEKHRRQMNTSPTFQFKEYDQNYITPERMREMMDKLEKTTGYMIGGYTAMLQDGECLVRTE